MNVNVKKQMVTGVFFSYLLIAVKLMTGIIYTPLILKTLGQSQYGIYSLTLSFAGYLTIFDAGTNAAYIRFFVQMKTKNEKATYPLNSFFLVFFLVLAFIAMILGLIISYNSDVIFGTRITTEEYVLIRKSLKLLSLSLFFEIFCCLWRSMIIANERFAIGKFINLLVSLAMPLGTIPFLLGGYDCSIIIMIRLIVHAMELLVDILYCVWVIKVKFAFKASEKFLVLTIFRFISFIVIQSIMDQMNWQIDKLILSRTQGTREISLYSVGTTFNNIYMTVSSAIAGVFIAETNRLVALNENGKLNQLFIKTSRICAYFILLIMIEYSLIGFNFVRIWAGIEYSSSYIVGFLLMFPLTFSLILGMGQDITRAKNKHHIQILLDFSVCVINVIASIPLAIIWGAVGSAVGTFFSELILCCVIQPIYYHKVIGLDMIKTYRNLAVLLKGCFIPIIYGSLVQTLNIIHDSYCSVLFHGIVIFILYAGSMYAFSFDDYEKGVFRKIRRKL